MKHFRCLILLDGSIGFKPSLYLSTKTAILAVRNITGASWSFIFPITSCVHICEIVSWEGGFNGVLGQKKKKKCSCVSESISVVSVRENLKWCPSCHLITLCGVLGTLWCCSHVTLWLRLLRADGCWRKTRNSWQLASSAAMCQHVKPLFKSCRKTNDLFRGFNWAMCFMTRDHKSDPLSFWSVLSFHGTALNKWHSACITLCIYRPFKTTQWIMPKSLATKVSPSLSETAQISDFPSWSQVKGALMFVR